jgi:chain length determinant protein EpsF
MNFSFLFSALRARLPIFFAILAATVAATVVISLIVPKTYVAQASVLVDGKDEQSLGVLGGVTRTPLDRDRIVGYLQTQVDILTSPRVARRVISDLKLTENPVVRASFEEDGGTGSIEEWLVESLRKRLKADFSQSSLIRLTYSSSDPRLSAQLANAFAKAYVTTVLELRVEPTKQTSLWFDEQLKGLRDHMVQAEKRLSDFQRQTGIVAVDERYDVESLQLADLARNFAAAREPVNGLNTARGTGGLPEIVTNPHVQSLKVDLARAEAALEKLSADYGTAHPQYQRQHAEVQALRERVRSEIGNVIAAAGESAQRLRDRKNRLESEMEAQRKRVLDLKQAHNQLAMLSRDVDIAQRTYDTAMQRFMASKIESRALQTNVSILSPAVTPVDPARPKLLLNTGIAALIGAMLGLTAVYLLELSDQRVRFQSDLAGDPQVPLLAVLNPWDPGKDRLLGAPDARLALPGPG